MTFKIKCPTIFGDNSVHEVLTRWKEGDTKKGEEWLAVCTKVLFEDQEYDPEIFVDTIIYELQDPYEDVIVEKLFYHINIVLDE